MSYFIESKKLLDNLFIYKLLFKQRKNQYNMVWGKYFFLDKIVVVYKPRSPRQF